MADKRNDQIQEEGAKKQKISANVQRYMLLGLASICIVVFAFSAFKLLSILNAYKKSRETYNELANSTNVSEMTDGPKDPVEVEVNGETIVVEYPPVEYDFKALKEVNSEIIGWIYSEDTVINYPLLQADNNQKYMYTLYNGDNNANGSLFADYICEPDFSSYNTVIYGHNMNDGSMFCSLINYGKQEYYDEHPIMYLLTPDQDYKVEIFSGYVTSYDSSAYTMSFKDELEFKQYLGNVKTQSKFDCDVNLDDCTNIITLSTCSYDFVDARFVVHGKLVPIGTKGLSEEQLKQLQKQNAAATPAATPAA